MLQFGLMRPPSSCFLPSLLLCFVGVVFFLRFWVECVLSPHQCFGSRRLEDYPTRVDGPYSYKDPWAVFREKRTGLGPQSRLSPPKNICALDNPRGRMRLCPLIPICFSTTLPASPPHRRRAMPPPAGLLPWPSPSTTRLTTPTPTRPPPRTTRVRPPPPPPPYTRVRLPPPPPPPTTPPPPRLEPAAPKPTAASTPLPPDTVSTASSSSTCLDCVHFGKYASLPPSSHTHPCRRSCELIYH